MTATARKKKPSPADDESRKLVDNAIQESKRLAESRLEMIRLFQARGQTEIARRRLQELIEFHPSTDEAKEAGELLKRLRQSNRGRR